MARRDGAMRCRARKRRLDNPREVRVCRKGAPRRTRLARGRRASCGSVHRPYMRYLAGKRLTTHEKKEKKKYREPFCRVLAHDGVEGRRVEFHPRPSRRSREPT